ncbi:MAG: 23S rRNA (pseudouridine(1915)-N(3))-methyltransferase RlmH [Symbiobacterium sp.]|uniref:23S rRNA (pseudouridine(1915)-N(3))-methyltransferase RlmH n=1 Tax=Symbiobacterium sp. TaxID=1971213 RepID=UPI003464AA80
MHIRLVTVGKVKERYLQEGIREYLKRLGPYARVEVVSVPDEPIPEGASPAQEEQVKRREGERILRVLGQGGPEHVVVLDARGKNLSSEELAAFLAERALRGDSSLAFVVGGSLGLDPAVLARADTVLSLGRMTFLHQMVPLILLEQIYRGFKINRGEKYHK